MKDLLCNNMLPSERKTQKQTKIALGSMWSQCGVGAVTKALGRCWLAQGTLVSRRKAWASSYDEEGLGCGISTGPLQASGFPFADSAFWAAVTICSLERGPQKNVPCLEMTNSSSLAGDRGWLLSGRHILRISPPRTSGLSHHDDCHWHEWMLFFAVFLCSAPS